jgi:hypothetical protein
MAISALEALATKADSLDIIGLVDACYAAAHGLHA